MSRAMLILHTLVFAALVVGCFTSPLFAYYYPELFKIYVLWVFGGIGILILGSWYFYSGACPLTVWENDFRKKEGKEPYSEGCMDRYAMRWFGLKLPPHFSDIVPIAILFIPLITRIFV